MGNIYKLHPKGNKRMESTNYKWKKTIKNIASIYEEAAVQTDLSIQFL